MDPEELNKILLHVVLNAWAKPYYLYRWYFEVKTYKETCEMFEPMETYKQVYEVGTPSKTTTRAEADHVNHGSKLKGG